MLAAAALVGISIANERSTTTLLKSANPGWGYHEIKEHLLDSGTPQEQLAAVGQSASLLNVDRAAYDQYLSTL